MELFQLVLAILTAFASIGGGVVYWLKKRSDGKYLELESRLKLAEAIANSELEKVKAAAAQSLSASESVQSLTGTIGTMVEERRESTVATKENTVATKENVEALKTMSISIDGLSKDRGEAVTALTVATTGLTTMLSQALVTLTETMRENTGILKEVASGQDELEDLFKQFALVVNRVAKQLNYDNKRFAEYMLRPTDVSKQGIEDIAAGRADEPASALPETVAVTA